MLIPFYDNNPISRTPFITYGIVAVNVVVFLWSLGMSRPDRQMLFYRAGFVPARIAQLVDRKPIEVNIAQEAPHPARPDPVRVRRLQFEPVPRQIFLSLVTCMFLHGGWLHLIGNMWFLWVFGNNVEDRVGPLPFLVFYLLGGLLASACHWMVEPDSTIPVVGASGAVATMLGAYAITWPWAKVKTLVFLFVIIMIVDLPALLVLGVWFLAQLIAATNFADLEMSGGVAWWAHVGGFVAGLILMPLLGAVLGATDDKHVLDQFGIDTRDSDDYF